MKELFMKPIALFLYGALLMAIIDVLFMIKPREKIIERQYELIDLADKTLSKCNKECDTYFNEMMSLKWKCTMDSLRHAAAAR